MVFSGQAGRGSPGLFEPAFPGGGNIYNISISESFAANDSYTALLSVATSISNSITVADSESIILIASPTLLNSITVADSESTTSSNHVSISETIVTLDSIAVANIITAALNEPIVCLDSYVVLVPSPVPPNRTLQPNKINTIFTPRSGRNIIPGPTKRIL